MENTKTPAQPHAIKDRIWDTVKVKWRSRLKSIRPFLGAKAASILPWLIGWSASRRILNTLYSSLPADQKYALFARFSRVFYGPKRAFADGEWWISFCGREIVIPLRHDSACLDWAVALGIEGQDPELKQTYAFLIRLMHPPRLVLDIGASYGMHSIIFLRHAIETISFEPNPRCHQFFRQLCEANGVKCRLEPLAIGAGEGSIDLWYPEGEEWLGTTSLTMKDQLSGELSCTTAFQTTVDAYVRSYNLAPDILKIDTEGTDMHVLAGAEWTLATHRPIVLFESLLPNRAGFFSILGAHQYQICRLPLSGDSQPNLISPEQFCLTDDENFAALPEEMLRSWPPAFSITRASASARSAV